MKFKTLAIIVMISGFAGSPLFGADDLAVQEDVFVPAEKAGPERGVYELTMEDAIQMRIRKVAAGQKVKLPKRTVEIPSSKNDINEVWNDIITESYGDESDELQ